MNTCQHSYSLEYLLNPNLIDYKVLPSEILNGVSVDHSVLEEDGTGGSGSVENNLVDRFGEVEVELGLIFLIEVRIHLLCYGRVYY